MLVDIPLPSVPIIVSSIATWFAPRRPRTLHKRPYRGVNVDVARRYPVASSDAWFDDPNSEEMETMSVATAVVFTACTSEHCAEGQLVLSEERVFIASDPRRNTARAIWP